MNNSQKDLLRSQIRFALQDRNIPRVAIQSGMSRNSLYKLQGADPVNMTTIRAACQYLKIDIPEVENEQ